MIAVPKITARQALAPSGLGGWLAVVAAIVVSGTWAPGARGVGSAGYRPVYRLVEGQEEGCQQRAVALGSASSAPAPRAWCWDGCWTFKASTRSSSRHATAPMS